MLDHATFSQAAVPEPSRLPSPVLIRPLALSFGSWLGASRDAYRMASAAAS